MTLFKSVIQPFHKASLRNLRVLITICTAFAVIVQIDAEKLEDRQKLNRPVALLITKNISIN